MGRYAGNGMQPFHAYPPVKGRSGAAMQADLDKRHQRDAASAEARRELEAAKLMQTSLRDRIEEMEVGGAPARKILDALRPEIDRARQLSLALEAERQRNSKR